MTSEDIKRLAKFFGDYFHQDWNTYAPTWEGVVDQFIIDVADKQIPARLSTMLDEFVQSYHDESELDQALDQVLECHYNPIFHGLKASEWLRHVSARLRSAAE